MNSDEYQDRLVDVLLSELVGKETPPDVRSRVIEAVDKLPSPAVFRRKPGPALTVLRPSKRSKTPVLAMAAVLTLLGVVGAVVQVQRISSSRTPVLTRISGTVDRSGGPIRPGESLSTGPRSSAVLSYLDGSVVELAPETTIMMTKSSPWDRSKGIEIVTGRVDAEVSPQIKGSPMVFSSVDARAEVVGTRLSFHLNEDRSRLEVSDGVVRFVPRKEGHEVLVNSKYFAESGKSGFRHEKIPVPGITRFTLMNADTDQPIREEPMVNGEIIMLSSLPTKMLNIRADFEGDPPDSVKISIRRHHDNPTGLEALPSDDHRHPPYFVAGDHWADGRPEDCAAWTPPAGLYHLSAEAVYADADKQALSEPLKITFRVEN